MRLATLLAPLAPPLCFGCRAAAGRAEPLCARCRRELRWLGDELVAAGAVELWAPLAYEGPARALVRGLKWGGAAAVAETMAAQITANAPPGLLAGRALVPVPLHPARRRRRGYNQAELIAAAVAARSGLELADCLERAGSRATQVGRDRAERLAGIAGAIGVRTGADVPADALLVDDVATTGATLTACAGALRAAGCSDVRALAYARTLGR